VQLVWFVGLVGKQTWSISIKTAVRLLLATVFGEIRRGLCATAVVEFVQTTEELRVGHLAVQKPMSLISCKHQDTLWIDSYP
jgi:predicted small integral membrane protein